MTAFTIRPATVADAPALSAIVQTLIAEWLVPDGHVGATERMRHEHSAAAIAGHIAEGWPYWLAECESAGTPSIIAYIALRPPTHLFNCYVSESWQGRGVGTALWTFLREQVRASAREKMIANDELVVTVSAALRSQAIYLRWGFASDGTAQCHEGLWFQPMRCLLPLA